MNDPARLITPEKRGEDVDTTLRPQSLAMSLSAKRRRGKI